MLSALVLFFSIILEIVLIYLFVRYCLNISKNTALGNFLVILFFVTLDSIILVKYPIGVKDIIASIFVIIYCVMVLDKINTNWQKRDEKKAKNNLYKKTIKECEII